MFCGLFFLTTGAGWWGCQLQFTVHMTVQSVMSGAKPHGYEFRNYLGWKFRTTEERRHGWKSKDEFGVLPCCIVVRFIWPWTPGHSLSRERQELFSLGVRSPFSVRPFHRPIGVVVKASAPRAEDPGFDFRLPRDFSGSSHTSDLKIGTPVATLPGAWRYKASTGTGLPGVSMLWLGEMESLISNFYLSVTARTVVWADPSLRYTSMLMGRLATNQPTNRGFLSSCRSFSINPFSILVITCTRKSPLKRNLCYREVAGKRQ